MAPQSCPAVPSVAVHQAMFTAAGISVSGFKAEAVVLFVCLAAIKTLNPSGSYPPRLSIQSAVNTGASASLASALARLWERWAQVASNLVENFCVADLWHYWSGKRFKRKLSMNWTFFFVINCWLGKCLHSSTRWVELNWVVEESIDKLEPCGTFSSAGSGAVGFTVSWSHADSFDSLVVTFSNPFSAGCWQHLNVSTIYLKILEVLEHFGFFHTVSSASWALPG